MNLRSICCALAITIFVCTSPARLTEISGGDFELWPGHQIIFFFIPRLLIYGQTIIFTEVYAYHYPCFYQAAKIAAARLWSCHKIPEKIVTGQEDANWQRTAVIARKNCTGTFRLNVFLQFSHWWTKCLSFLHSHFEFIPETSRLWFWLSSSLGQTYKSFTYADIFGKGYD